MGNQEEEQLEWFWAGIFSRNPEEIMNAFMTVPPAIQKDCLNHLKKMTIENGWHVEQVKSAQFALEILK
mgnify:CR=1 FL=1